MPGAHLESSRRVVVAEWAGGGQAVSAALLSSQNLGREGDPVHALVRGSYFLPTHSPENSSFKLEITLLKIGENKRRLYCFSEELSEVPDSI